MHFFPARNNMSDLLLTSFIDGVFFNFKRLEEGQEKYYFLIYSLFYSFKDVCVCGGGG